VQFALPFLSLTTKRLPKIDSWQRPTKKSRLRLPEKPTSTPSTGVPASVTVAVSVWVAPTGFSAVFGASAIEGWCASQLLVAVSSGSLASFLWFSFESTKAVIVSRPPFSPV